jgi:hypothetical protein
MTEFNAIADYIKQLLQEDGSSAVYDDEGNLVVTVDDFICTVSFGPLDLVA